MRTGSHWVILVKFPLGFGFGSNAKLPVVALPMVCTRVSVDPNFHRLPDHELANLRLLDIRLDPDALRVMHDRKTLTRSHVFARLRECSVHHPVDGASNGAARDIESLLLDSPPHLRLPMTELVELTIEHIETGAFHPRFVHLGHGLLELGHRHAVLGFDPPRLRPRLFELLHRNDPLVMERLRAIEFRQCKFELRLQCRHRTSRRTMGRTRSLQPAPRLLVDEFAFRREPFSFSACGGEAGFELFEQQDLLACIDSCNELIASDAIARRGGKLDQSTRHPSTHRDEVRSHACIVFVHMGESLLDLCNHEPGPRYDHRQGGDALKKTPSRSCRHFDTSRGREAAPESMDR